MFFILISLTLFRPVFMYDVDLRNQTSECGTWIQNHVFDNTQLHSETIDHANIRVDFEYLDRLNGMGCKDLKIYTRIMALVAKRKTLIENKLNLTELLNLINFTIPNDIIYITNNKHSWL